MFNNKGRRRKFHSNSNRPFRRRHNGEGRGSNSPNAIMDGQFRQNSFKGPYNTANTARLIEKYNTLAKEALSAGDRILAENYFQHADHFLRINSTNTTPTTTPTTTPNNFSTIDKNSNLEEVKISSQDGETRPENDTLDKIEKNKTK